MIMTQISREALGWMILSLISFYGVISVVLHVCLENVDDEDLLSVNNDWHPSIINRGDFIAANLVKNAAVPAVPAAGIRSSSSSTANGIPQEVASKFYTLRAQETSSAKTRRQIFEEDGHHPSSDMVRIKKAVDALRLPPPTTQASMPYDVWNCPSTPPVGYPMTWSLNRNILKDWNVDVTDIPSSIYNGLCMFDWDKDLDKAQTYREAELPFVLQNTPEVLRAAERWNQPSYLQELIGDSPQRNEHSKSNHLMWWKIPRNNPPPNGWEPPSENVDLSYAEFLKRAQEMEGHKVDQASREHWYFRLNASPKTNGFLYDELPIFWPSTDDNEPSFFVVSPEEQRGINCRFGMRGNLAELHFDGHRNFIVLMGGQRRYILADPASECGHLELYSLGHPSGRHSSIDFSHPPPEDYSGPFSQAMANEVVLQAGDVLYLPDSWLHLIVNLSINFQCNARSGEMLTEERRKGLAECGFPSLRDNKRRRSKGW